MQRASAVAVLAVSLLLTSSASASGNPKISVLGGNVSAKAGSGKQTADVFLNVVNAGPGEVPITVAFTAASATGVSAGAPAPATIGEKAPTRVKVTFKGLSGHKQVKGVVVIGGGAAPVYKEATLTPGPDPAAAWPAVLPIGAAVAMLLLFVIVACVVARRKGARRLVARAPGPKWSFDSWATTLTTVGAVLGTVLAAATFPTVPRGIGKANLVELNLLFAGLVVLAPFVFQAIRTPQATPADHEAGRWGFNLTLLLACSITFGAVLGEIAALALLGWEIIGGGYWAVVAVVGLTVVGLVALWYFSLTAYQLAATDWAATTAEPAAGGVIGVAGPPEALDQVEVTVAPPTRLTVWRLP
jgi:hypothetical protein